MFGIQKGFREKSLKYRFVKNGFTSIEFYLQNIKNLPPFKLAVIDDQTYCPISFDGLLCWPRTPAGHTITQYCPDFVTGWNRRFQAHKVYVFIFCFIFVFVIVDRKLIENCYLMYADVTRMEHGLYIRIATTNERGPITHHALTSKILR